MITRVNENNLGGKVVWLRPEGRDFTLYYAHLDEQVAREGQEVLAGDTLGLMGNTGNARNTATHLHFGVYTVQGAVDPLPFIDPVIKPVPKIVANIDNLHKTMRTASSVNLKGLANGTALAALPKGTPVTVNAAHAGFYRVELPDGKSGLLGSTELVSISSPLKTLQLTATQSVLHDAPKTEAAVKLYLKPGNKVNVLGGFENYYLVDSGNAEVGWIVK